MLSNILSLISELVNEGIEVTIKRDRFGEVFADLNAETKSHMYLYTDGTVRGRYGESEPVLEVQDVAHIFVERYGRRGSGSERWVDLACRLGYLKKVVKTTVDVEVV